MPGMNPHSAPARKPADHGGGNQEPARPRVKKQGEPRGHEGTGDDLSLSPDVDHVGAECNADAQPHEQKRRRLHQGLGEAEPGAHRASNQGCVGGKGVGLQDDQHHGSDEEGEDHTRDREKDVQRDPAPVDARNAHSLRLSRGFPSCQDCYLSPYLYHTCISVTKEKSFLQASCQDLEDAFWRLIHYGGKKKPAFRRQRTVTESPADYADVLFAFSVLRICSCLRVALIVRRDGQGYPAPWSVSS